jgi:predicted small secreted protein
MKEQLRPIILAVVLIAFVVAVCTTAAKVTKSTGKDAAILRPAVDVFPGSVYDNADQIPGAAGRVNMVQPNGNVDVIIAVSADRLAATTQYRVIFDTDGITPGDVGTAGPWVPRGSFRTDENGHGEWKFITPRGTLGDGTYTYSVFINRTDVNRTVLISTNVEFVIASE